MAKHKGGRATVMTPVVLAKLEEAFAWGCSDVEACLWAGIATKTMYLYQEKHPEFLQRKQELKETPILLARQSVIKGVKRDPKIALDFLSRKKKDEFGTNVDVTTNGQSMTQLVVIRSEKDSSQDAQNDVTI